MNAQNLPKHGNWKPLSAKVRKAIHARVYGGLSWDNAARAAGMSPAGIFKQKPRPDFQEELERVTNQYLQESKQAEARLNLLAVDTIAQALASETDWAEKRKWVELLRREPKSGPQINVQNNVQNLPPQGYAYAPPGSRVVKIDPPSSDGNTQAIDNSSETPLIGSSDVISGEIASPKVGGSRDE